MVAALVASGLLLAQASYPRNEVPDAVRRVFAEADRIEVFSLDPYALFDDEDLDRRRRNVGLNRYKSLGSTVVTAKGTKEGLVRAVVEAVDAKTWRDQAMCFHPRHGLRASAGGKTAELVICFQCQSVVAYLDGKTQGSSAIAREPQAELNRLLQEAKIPLAPSAGGP